MLPDRKTTLLLFFLSLSRSASLARLFPVSWFPSGLWQRGWVELGMLFVVDVVVVVVTVVRLEREVTGTNVYSMALALQCARVVTERTNDGEKKIDASPLLLIRCCLIVTRDFLYCAGVVLQKRSSDGRKRRTFGQERKKRAKRSFSWCRSRFFSVLLPSCSSYHCSFARRREQRQIIWM